ncbi:hypothetical protein NLI96_g3940 [Meripilus lineatus]|uniref:F-box domain-containing protein n=1 Tax=Meripilus lineatus TaxID=2056292 RepID=A0AAD5VB53_9APHY|nr:hypothetical protein NLI96_g3940 [Physisporinus lineatus]
MLVQSVLINPSTRSFEGIGDDKEAIAWLDREATKAFSQFISLRASRNDRVIACRIPDELKIEIAKAAQCLTHGDKDSEQPFTHHWLRLSQICSRWRETLNGTPLLWTSILANNVDRALAFLQRSQGLPLNIYLSRRLPENDQKAFLDLVNLQACRVKSLNLCLSNTDLFEITPSLNAALPLLERLCLKVPTKAGYPRSYPPRSLVFQPKRSCDPPLHTLILDSVALSWDLPILKDLRVLELIRSRDARSDFHESGLRFSHLMSILESCPLLEKLRIVTLGSPSYSLNPRKSEGIRIVRLPKLKQLEIQNAPEVLALLLSNLRIPTSAKVLLKPSMFNGRGPEPDYVTPFPSSLISNIPAVSQTAKVFLTSNWDDRNIILRAGPIHAQITKPDDWPIVVEFILPCTVPIDDIKALALSGINEDIARIFGPSVREIVIEGSHSGCDRRPTWPGLFAGLPQLQALSLKFFERNPYRCMSDDFEASHVIDALNSDILPGGGGTVCPGLKEVRITGDALCGCSVQEIYYQLRDRASFLGKLEILQLAQCACSVPQSNGVIWTDVAEQVDWEIRPMPVDC